MMPAIGYRSVSSGKTGLHPFDAPGEGRGGLWPLRHGWTASKATERRCVNMELNGGLSISSISACLHVAKGFKADAIHSAFSFRSVLPPPVS